MIHSGCPKYTAYNCGTSTGAAGNYDNNTTATHNSRYSQRMFYNHVKLGEAVCMDEKDELIVAEINANRYDYPSSNFD